MLFLLIYAAPTTINLKLSTYWRKAFSFSGLEMNCLYSVGGVCATWGERASIFSPLCN